MSEPRRQFGVFVLGGLLCAALDVGLMQLLLWQGSKALLATSCGFLAGLLLNYAFHARVTFGQLASGASFLRFLCVVAINYTITVALVSLAIALGLPPLAGKVVSLPVVAVNGFLLSKHWIFK
ncbi:GtrA family protein [Pseudoduganella danionis]|uniref:GtrA family protein n=1 Tax=Pseudoduganella danionis TaxID=1890295 RepID=A0ABW9SHW5_9BURK|nr:GtrA family protein [Pseudoduganella danionis]MTW31673.1 GtrA family protein [Pseudoduganella danionis]